MHQKAQVAEEFFYAIFYLTMTSVVVFFMVIIPTTILENTYETHDRDNVVWNERVFAKASTKDELTLRVIPGVLENPEKFTTKSINKSFDFGKAPRKVAFKLTYDTKSIYFDKEFYDIAKPLSPVAYPAFTQSRPLLVKNELKRLEIDQVFSKKQKWS